MKEPLIRPNPRRVSMDDTNGTIQDISESLVAVMSRIQELESKGGSAEARASIGVWFRFRKVCDKFERHLLDEAAAVTGEKMVRIGMESVAPVRKRELRKMLKQG